MIIVKEDNTTSIKKFKTKIGAKLFIYKMKKYGQYWKIYIEHKEPKNKNWTLKRGGIRS